MMEKDLAYYLNLPYTRELIREESGIWFARIKELPNCMSQGNTPEEALHNIEEAMLGWIKGELEDGEPIPEPRPEEEYSGKFNTRVPRSLHRKLVEAAERDDVSLNQWINTALAEAVGRATNDATPHFLSYYLSTKIEPPSKCVKETKAATLEPTSNPQAELLLKVDALTGLEQYPQALETLEQAQRETPTEVIFYRYAAALLLKLGKPQEALAQLKAARKAKAKFDQPTRALEKKIKSTLSQAQ